METLLVAVVAIAVGGAAAAFGARLFAVLLPVWGFLTGLLLGADILAVADSTSPFATLDGWIAGAGLGIVLAAVAALWFSGAVLILGIGLGTAVGGGLAAIAGADVGGASLGLGVTAGALVGMAIRLTETPSQLVAAITAYGGAMWAVAGGLLLIGRIHVADLHGVGPAGAIRGDIPAVALVFLVGTAAFALQARDLRRRRIATLDRDRFRF